MGGLVRAKRSLDPGPRLVRDGLCPASAPGAGACLSGLAFCRCGVLPPGGAAEHRLWSLRCAAVPPVLLYRWPAEEILGLRRDFLFDVLWVPVCLSSGNPSTFGGAGTSGLPSAGSLPGAPVLLAPPGAVWLLLVLPFAHAAFGAILLAGNMALTAMDHGPNGRNHRHQTTLLIPGKGRWQPGPGCSPGWA